MVIVIMILKYFIKSIYLIYTKYQNIRLVVRTGAWILKYWIFINVC